MPRTPRLDAPGARHHVMNRAVARRPIFHEDADCALFVDTLEEVPARFGARIHGYVVMPNHYHLMVEVPRGNLSRVMRHVGAAFTQRYNRARGQDGPVFRGRFRNRVVLDDAYWMHLLAYLHLNPVRARLCRRPGDWDWSSHKPYAQGRTRHDWLTTTELLEAFGGAKQLVAYVDGVHRKGRQAPTGFDPDHFWEPPDTFEAPTAPRAEPRTPDQALSDVAAVMGLPVDLVLDRPWGARTHLGAWVAAWWLGRATELSQASIAGLLGVSRARVSQLVNGLHDRALRDPAVRGIMETLAARQEV